MPFTHVQRGHQVDSVSRGAEEDRVQGRDGRIPGHDPGAIGQRTHRVRQGQDGQTFPEVFEDQSWTDWFIRAYEKSPKPQHQMYVQYVLKRVDHEITQDMTKNQTKESEKMKECLATRLSRLRCVGSDLRTGSSGELLRNASPSQDSTGGGTSGQSLYGEQAVGKSHHEHGDGHAGGPHACASTECESRAVESTCSADVHMHDRNVDLDFDFIPSQEHNSFKARIQRDVRKFSKELHDIVIQVRSKPRCQQPRLDLLEVMCSGESELTKQMQRLGGKAQRFGTCAR